MAPPREPESWRLEWNYGALEVLSVGAILRSCTFYLPQGRNFAPFAAAPWIGDPAYSDLPGHMRWLGGEFACLPFGVGGVVQDATASWRDLLTGSSNAPPHGDSANGLWALAARDHQQLTLFLEYPDSSPIVRVARSMKAVPDAPALEFSFVVEVRRACRFPVGLHPILDLDRPAERVELHAQFDFGLTYPAIVPPDEMLAMPGREFDVLSSVPARNGGTVDLTRLPRRHPVEDVVQLCGVRAPVAIDFLDAGARLTIDWGHRPSPVVPDLDRRPRPT